MNPLFITAFILTLILGSNLALKCVTDCDDCVNFEQSLTDGTEAECPDVDAQCVISVIKEFDLEPGMIGRVQRGCFSHSALDTASKYNDVVGQDCAEVDLSRINGYKQVEEVCFCESDFCNGDIDSLLDRSNRGLEGDQNQDGNNVEANQITQKSNAIQFIPGLWLILSLACVSLSFRNTVQSP